MSKAYSWIGAVVGGLIGLLVAVMSGGLRGVLTVIILLNLAILCGIFSVTVYKVFKYKHNELKVADSGSILKYTIIWGIVGGFLAVLGMGGDPSTGLIFGMFFGYIAGAIILGISAAEMKWMRYGIAILSFISPPVLIGAIIAGIVSGIVGVIVYSINRFSIIPFSTPIFIFAFIGYIIGNPIGTWIENVKLERQRLAEEQRRKEEERIETERREQERKEHERRRAEEERQRQEEEERRRLEGMKQKVLDKIEEAIKDE